MRVKTMSLTRRFKTSGERLQTRHDLAQPLAWSWSHQSDGRLRGQAATCRGASMSASRHGCRMHRYRDTDRQENAEHVQRCPGETPCTPATHCRRGQWSCCHSRVQCEWRAKKDRKMWIPPQHGSSLDGRVLSPEPGREYHGSDGKCVGIQFYVDYRRRKV